MSEASVDIIATAQSEVEHTRQARRAARLQNRIDGAPMLAFAALSLAYFIVTFSLSTTKLLWLDELITLHIARVGGPAAIWHALARGADPNPPVTHILVHLSRSVFGDHEWAYRLPAMVGYWVGLLALYSFLRRWYTATWALAGTVLSMCMAAFEYSYESRSYGIFYGLAMLAVLCWSVAVDAAAKKRTLALAGMVFALALGISTNYFAVLAFLPIAGGEAVRTFAAIRTGRKSSWLAALDLRIWIGLALAALPLVAYRGLIAHSIAQFAPYAWNKVSLQQVFDSYDQMVEVVLYPILALFVLGIAVSLARRALGAVCSVCRSRLSPAWISPVLSPSDGPQLAPHELTAVLLLMAYPILGYIVASIRGGMLSPRFVIPVCFGFAIAATLVAHYLFARLPRAGLIFLCFMIAWFVCRESYVGYWYEEQKQCLYKILDHLPEAERALPAHTPIVIPDPLLALTFQHYAPSDVAARVVFPVDFPAIRRTRGDDSPEENLWAGRGFLYTMPIETLARFQRNSSRFLIIAGDGNWLVNDLNDHNYSVERLPINTRAAAMGGFTPLARGVPSFFIASWTPRFGSFDSTPAPLLVLPPEPQPVPFRAQDNVPDAAAAAGDGASQ